MKGYSVVLATFKCPQYLELAVRSIFDGEDHDDNDLIIVVDGFSDMYKQCFENIKEFLAPYPQKKNRVIIADFPENFGMAYAINYGVMLSNKERIIIANDDNIFGPNWDSALDKHYDENTVTTINQIEPLNPGMFGFVAKNLGTNAETFEYDKFIEFEKTIRSDTVTENGRIFPFLINKKWFMACGGFDTYYPSPNWVDVDFFNKLELMGTVKFERIHSLHFYHFGSVATRKGPDAPDFIAREQAAAHSFINKWGYLPDLASSALYRNNSKFPNDKEVMGVRYAK